MKPVLFITGHVPASRRGAFAALGARVPLELALYGGPHQHGAPPGPPPDGVGIHKVSQREIGRLVAGGDYAAVIAGTGGRVALPLAWRAARAHGVPFIFWAALWRTPRVAAHLAAIPLMRRIYRESAAVVTYGAHVSAYVAAHGAQRIFVAPQAVDNAFWSAPLTIEGDERFCVLFVGRDERAKGLRVLLDAWHQAAFSSAEAALTLVGAHAPGVPGVSVTGQLDPEHLRNFYGASQVLVIPSIPTRRFIEPWGLVVNEAMNQECSIIASDAVGAAAGGLVQDGRNGLIVPAGDSAALAHALRELAGNRARCAELGRAGRADVAAYTYDAWADGFVAALAGVSARPNPGSVRL
ncbi:MAG: glycosyltransferase family 4 protein [Solirubrobacteraceae bacterium]|jgi:glycosyltransferase involved in cell wall biosynthesis